MHTRGHASAVSCADVFCVLRSYFTNSSLILNLQILKSFSMTANDKLRKENQVLRNEIEELKKKLLKVIDELSKNQHGRHAERELSPGKGVQLNLRQANMTTSSASKWKLRGKFRYSSHELTKYQFCAIILGNLASEAYSYQFNIKIVVHQL